MNLWDRLRRVITRDATPTTLRNKPGGLAWLRNLDAGAEDLNGCIVTTVSYDGAGFWVIEPSMQFRLRDYRMGISGGLGCPGDIAELVAARDDCLVPIPDTGVSDEEVADLFAPTREGAHA